MIGGHVVRGEMGIAWCSNFLGNKDRERLWNRRQNYSRLRAGEPRQGHFRQCGRVDDFLVRSVRSKAIATQCLIKSPKTVD